MGLKNGVAIFQRVIEFCLKNVADVADPYVDDVITGTMGKEGKVTPEVLQAHDADIRRVLDALKEHQMVADLKKCKFFVKEVEFCGHILGGGERRPAPGKLMALEKWEEPKTVTALRGFLGFTNYYSSYVPGYAELAASLMDLLKVGKKDGKKGSKVPVLFGEEERKAFQAIKDKLQEGLRLRTVNPDRPFILRVDASGRAVGAALEQFVDEEVTGRPTLEEVAKRKTAPVAFCSRKLAPGQVRSWSPREKETYAVVLALQKWASWIGLQPVLVLTDHKSLESWATETLDTPSGPAGRRGRWHELLSKFDVTVVYIPGKDNVVADALSRWAYPASKAFADVSIHGSEEDDHIMREIIEEDRKEERGCLGVFTVPEVMEGLKVLAERQLKDLETTGRPESEPNDSLVARLRAEIAVTTRRGAKTGGDHEDPLVDASPLVRRQGESTGPQAGSSSNELLDFTNPADNMAGMVDEAGNMLHPMAEPPALSQRVDGQQAEVQEKAAAGQPFGITSPRRRTLSEAPEVPIQDIGAPQGSLADQGTSESTAQKGVLQTPGLEDDDCPRPVMDKNWESEYRACPTWGPLLAQVKDSTHWPKGVQIRDGRVYKDGTLCIPSTITGQVIRELHRQAGHPGGIRLWDDMGRWYSFADPKSAKAIAKKVQGQCEVCQAVDPSRLPYKCPIEPTPIPPYLMDSVSVDLFAMPEVTVGGKVYDTLVLCVDRESGWMVGTAHQNKGLTAQQVAKDMFRQWEMFGIPSKVSSDRGPHFASAWWKTLCAAHGVQVAYGHAYHHQAQGRVENAGQQVLLKMSKLNADEGTPWVELLPRVLRHIHDMPGASGFSPYEIVFGRHRHMASLPYRPEKEAEDATCFVERMKRLDTQVAKTLNDLQAKRASLVNKNRREPPPLKVGAKVWYHPERQPGTDKLEVRWKGPGRVLERVGEHSYVVELKPGGRQHAHRSQLRPHVEDEFTSKPVPMYYFAEKAPVLDTRSDEWLVDHIVQDKIGANGERVFLTRWQGYGPESDTWEPLSHFFPQYNTELVKYCKRKDIHLNLADLKQEERRSSSIKRGL